MSNKVLLLFILLTILFGTGILFVGGKKQTALQQNTQVASPTSTFPNQTILTSQPTVTLPSPTTTSNAPKEATVTLTQQGFSPQTVMIKKGGIVTWINQSSTLATVNSDAHPTHLLYPPLNLGEFDNNQSFQLSFDKTGKFTYHNHLNPSQTGSVIVVE